jgi:predicted RNase H-like HicB family nuclease
VSRRQNIDIEFDPETGNYFIIWEPLVISLGGTQEEALEDLREAVHHGLDLWIDLKLQEMEQEKEA